MKKQSFHSIIFCSALLITASVFNSCKKEVIDENNSAVFGQVYYEQRAPGSSVRELRVLNTNDAAYDHQVKTIAPTGWELRDDRKIAVNYYNQAISAYNPTTKLYSVFASDGPPIFELPYLSGIDVEVQGFIGDSTTIGLLYSKRNLNNEIEFWRTVYRGNAGYNRKVNIPLPANVSFVEEPFVNTSPTDKSKIAFATRVQNTYAIYQCSFNGAGLSVVTTDEPGVALAVEEVIYPGVVLYSKNKNSGSATELWLINTDGTNKRKISLNLPNGTFLKNKDMAKVSHDGVDLAFLTTTSIDNPNAAIESLYTAKIDGSDVKLIKKFAAGVKVDIRSFDKVGGY